MFTVTNLVDRNLGEDTQTIYPEFSMLVHQRPDATQLKYSITKKQITESQRGRMFFDGDAFVQGMIFKKKMILPNNNILSELIVPGYILVNEYYVIDQLVLEGTRNTENI